MAAVRGKVEKREREANEVLARVLREREALMQGEWNRLLTRVDWVLVAVFQILNIVILVLFLRTQPEGYRP